MKKGRGKDRTKRKRKLARNIAIGAAGVGSLGLAAVAARNLSKPNSKKPKVTDTGSYQGPEPKDQTQLKKGLRSLKLEEFRNKQGMTSDKQSKLKQSLKDKSTSVKRATGGRTDYSNQQVDSFLKRKRKDLTLKTYDRKGRNVTKKERTKAIGFSKNMYQQTQLANFAKIKASGKLAKAGKLAAQKFRATRGMANSRAVAAEMRRPKLLGVNQPPMQMNTIGGVRKTYTTRRKAQIASNMQKTMARGANNLRKANPVTNALRRKNFR